MQPTIMLPATHIPRPALAEAYEFLFPQYVQESVKTEAEPAEQMETEEDEPGVEKWDDWGESETPSQNRRCVIYEDWLQYCHITTVPSFDFLVMAYETRFVVFKKGSDGEMEVGEKRETEREIRALLAIPMMVSKRSETRAQDWVAIAIANDSGELLLFSDGGQELLRERWSREAALSLQFARVLHGGQELSILFNDCLVTVDGLSLYAALTTARSQVIRRRPRTEAPELVFKKWMLEEMGEARAHACLGPIRPTAFHQLETASMIGGARSSLSGSIPQRTSYVTIGERPFLGFYPIEESASHVGLSDAVLNLADKVRSSVSASASSYLGYLWGGGGEEKKKEKTPGEDVRPLRVKPRNLFYDGSREGERLFPAPLGDLLAVADAQARVMLVNAKNRLVLRVWKGYRDAEVGWLMKSGTTRDGRVEEEDGTNGGGALTSRALFLVILAPRRGLLEIWSLQNGPRVAAAKVHKKSRLLQASSRCWNLGESSESGQREPPLWLLHPSGEIRSITVPFHAALQDDSSAHIHDTLLLKELLPSLSETESLSTALVTGLKKLRTIAALKAVVDHIVRQEKSGFSPKLAATLLEEIGKILDAKAEASSEAKVLRATLNVQLQQLHTFAALLRMRNDPQGQLGRKSEDVGAVLQCTKEELDTLMEVVGEAAELERPEPPLPELTFAQFAASFRHSFSSLDADSWTLSLTDNLEESEVAAIGAFLLLPLLSGRTSLEHYRLSVLRPLRLPDADVMRLSLAYWLGERKSYSLYPPTLLFLLRGLGQEPPLEEIQEALLRTRLLPEAYALVLIARALSKDVQLNQSDQDLDMVHLEISEEKWDLLVRHLELLTRLQLWAMRLRASLDTISLGQLLSKGKSYYREQVARLAVASGVGAEDLWSERWLDTEVGRGLSRLRQELPLSLETEAVHAEAAWEAGSAWFRDPERVELLYACSDHLKRLTHPRLQHGLALSLWDTFLRKPTRNLHLLLQKVGKHPKDRMCKKEVGVGEEHLLRFVKSVMIVLDVHLAGNVAFETSTDWEDRFEAFVTDLFTLPTYKERAGAGRASLLSMMGGGEKCTNYQLVQHHRQLVLVVRLMLHLRYRPARPAALFDAKGLDAFFMTLHAHPILSEATVDEPTKAERAKFLKSCIRLDGTMEIEEPTRYEADCRQLIWDLAADWEVDEDLLRREEASPFSAVLVMLLVDQERETEAMERLETVEGKAELGSELLHLLGERLSFLLSERRRDPSLADALSTLPPRALDWLSAFPPPPSPPQPQALLKERLLSLHAHLLSLLSSAHADNTIVNQLLPVIQTLA